MSIDQPHRDSVVATFETSFAYKTKSRSWRNAVLGDLAKIDPVLVPRRSSWLWRGAAHAGDTLYWSKVASGCHSQSSAVATIIVASHLGVLRSAVFRRRRSVDTVDADEIALAAAFESVVRYRVCDEDPFRSWMYRRIDDALKTASLRQEAQRRIRPVAALVDDRAAYVASELDPMMLPLGLDDLTRYLTDLGLKEEDARLLVATDVMGNPLAWVTDQLQLTVTGVSARRKAARRALSELLGPELEKGQAFSLV